MSERYPLSDPTRHVGSMLRGATIFAMSAPRTTTQLSQVLMAQVAAEDPTGTLHRIAAAQVSAAFREPLTRAERAYATATEAFRRG